MNFLCDLPVRCGLIIALSYLQPWQPIARTEPIQLDSLYPGGIRVGETRTLTAQGKLPIWPVGAWVDHPAIAVETTEEKGQLKVQTPDDVRPGVYWLRLFDSSGATKLRPLVIGTLPEVLESEPNDRPRQPQAIDQPATVHGRLEKSGDVDVYAVQLKQGQILVADMTANCVLGSPMDAVLQICRSDGIVLRQNHDTIGLDPRLVFHAPQDGTYLIRMFAFPSNPGSRITFAGESSYVYRLTVTTSAFVDHMMPMVLSATQMTDLQLFGWNISEDQKHIAVAPPDTDFVDLRSLVAAPTANRIHLPLSDANRVVSAEMSESDEPEEPQLIELPVVISGRLGTPGDEDVFRFHVSEKQRLRFRVASRSHGYPVDAVLRLVDADQKTLQENDDVDGKNCDAGFTYEVPGEGRYDVSIRDLHGRGGFRYVYRLTIEVPQPDFELTLAAETFTVPPGESLEIDVSIDRQDGFGEELEITAIELPEGVSVESAKSLPEGDSAKSVKLKVTASAESAGTGGVLRIAGTSLGDLARRKIARFQTVIQTRKHDRAWLTVAEEAAKK